MTDFAAFLTEFQALVMDLGGSVTRVHVAAEIGGHAVNFEAPAADIKADPIDTAKGIAEMLKAGPRGTIKEQAGTADV